MRKILFLLCLLYSLNGFSQSYTQKFNVVHGDTIFLKTTVTDYTWDSTQNIIYSSHYVPDSSIVQGQSGDSTIYFNTVVYDTTIWYQKFRVVTNVTADSVQINKFAIQPPLQSGANIKTINGDPILGSGDLPVSGSGATWSTITGLLSSQLDLQAALDSKQATITNGSISNAQLANGAVANLSGTNTGDNAANTTYANDYRAANFVAGTNYLAPDGNGSQLTGLTKAQVGLANADNTSDANKPVSVAQQSALDAKQGTLSLTTTGTSGAATFIGSTLNVPNYATGGGMTRVFLPSDVINNNAVANTIADVTGLSFAVTANTTYQFRFVIVYSSAATTTGSRWSINGPATTHMGYTSQYTITATSITNNAALSGYNLPAASNASSLTTNNRCIIEGEIRPSANGTVIARFASEVANSAVTAVASGRSYVEYQIIN